MRIVIMTLVALAGIYVFAGHQEFMGAIYLIALITFGHICLKEESWKI